MIAAFGTTFAGVASVAWWGLRSRLEAVETAQSVSSTKVFDKLDEIDKRCTSIQIDVAEMRGRSKGERARTPPPSAQ